VGAKLIT